MTLSRRRFLSISAACLVAGPAQAAVWRGRALGAEVEITIRGPRDVANPALVAARDALARVEAQFNLFDATSRVAALNREGRLETPDPDFLAVMRAAGRIHAATGGLFDPTVQPLWRALAEGRDPAPARRLIGWHRVRYGAGGITLAPGQALTFNGIAQGFATDRVARVLAAAGMRDTLVNIGEFRGTGGPWTLGLSDPAFGHLGTRTITAGAVATSSPGAMQVGAGGHIVHRAVLPQWSTVSVEAADAMTADAFSTALTLAPLKVVRGLSGRHGIRRITLVTGAGEVMTV